MSALIAPVEIGFHRFKNLLNTYRSEKNGTKNKSKRLVRKKGAGGFTELLMDRVKDAFSHLVEEKADLFKAYEHLQKQGLEEQTLKEKTPQGQALKKHQERLESLSDAQIKQLYDFLLQNQHVQLHLQEKHGLQNGQKVHKGFEALLRPPKQMAALGIIPFEINSSLYQGLESLIALGPEGFCRTAQHRGVGFELDSYVFEQSAQLYAQHANGAQTKININILPSTFAHPDFAQGVQAYCTQLGVDPKHFGFEILESERTTDLKALKQGCQRLQKIGSSVSIDDFCTGHAHPGYLYYLPVDEIKIPRDMLQLMDDPKYAKTADAWIQKIVQQAHKNGLDVVCEGVENEQQARYLQAIGVDSAQGYHFAKPQPAAQQLTELTQRHPQLASGQDVSVPEQHSILNDQVQFHTSLARRLLQRRPQDVVLDASSTLSR